MNSEVSRDLFIEALVRMLEGGPEAPNLANIVYGSASEAGHRSCALLYPFVENGGRGKRSIRMDTSAGVFIADTPQLIERMLEARVFACAWDFPVVYRIIETVPDPFFADVHPSWADGMAVCLASTQARS